MNFSSDLRKSAARPMSRPAGACIVLAALAALSTQSAYGALTATPATITLSCTTTGGPSAAVNVVVKPSPLLTTGNTIAVTVGTLPAGVTAVTVPATQTLTTANQSAGLVYSFRYSAGCAGATAGTATPTFQFAAGGTPDATVTINSSVTASTSALVASPSALTIVCIKSGSTYTPGPARTVSVTSAATLGTPFTVDTVTNPAAGWLTVTPTSGGTAGDSAGRAAGPSAAAAVTGGVASGVAGEGVSFHLLLS